LPHRKEMNWANLQQRIGKAQGFCPKEPILAM